MTRQLLSDKAKTTEKATETKEERPLMSEPGKFDMALWASGVKPIKRSVTLYQRLDLMAERDELGGELQLARAQGDETKADAILTRIDQLTVEMEQTSILVTLQGITPSKFSEVLKEAETKSYIKEADEVQLWIVANQVVEPEGITYEVLKDLNELMPAQIQRLCETVNQINSIVPHVRATAPF